MVISTLWKRDLFLVLLLGGLLAPPVSFAQLYSWADPDTGNKHVSNVAPSWYGVGKSVGPRVLVTKGATVLDDTGLTVAERTQLQAKAKFVLSRRKEELEEGAESVDSAEIEKDNLQGEFVKKSTSMQSQTQPSGASPQTKPPPKPPPLSRGGPKPENRQ